MFRKPAVVTMFVFAALLAASSAVQAHGATHIAALDSRPGLEVPLMAGPTSSGPYLVPAPHSARGDTESVSAASVATATIQVTYTDFPANAKAAFQAAVDEWQTMLVSTQVIHVDAAWTPMGATSGLLGQAGPSNFYLLSDNRWYPVALAEAKCSCELNGSKREISAAFNSDFGSWYLGSDGAAPSNKYDFETVVLHELGHGLGFLSTFAVNSSTGNWGWSSGGHIYPTQFDAHEWSAASGGSKMTSFANPSTALADQLTDGSVYFDGANVEDVLGHRAKLFAPNQWQSGSSNSHLDESAYPSDDVNALMTPALSGGEVHHDPGPLMLAVFRDIGWTTADALPPPTEPGAPQNATATAGNGAADVAWDAPASDGGSAITGYTVTSDPDSRTCATSGATACTVNGLANDTTYTFTVTATNDVGTGPASDPSAPVTPSDQVPDTTAPAVGLPTVTIAAPRTLGATAQVHVTWPDATDASGIAAYELQLKKGSVAWAAVVLGSPTDTTVDTALKPGASYRFRLRATDGASNVGAWTVTGSATLRLRQEKAAAIAYHGRWKRHAVSGASGGYVRSAGAAARTASLTFSGSSGALVSTLGPNRGIVDIWLDGTHVASVDLYAPALTTRAVVWVTDAALSLGRHTIQLRSTGTHDPSATGNRVDLDAFLIWP